MAWSIAEVARMSKVTARTLRYYDDIGLLAPAHIGINGYRYYEQEQLLRLQQILLLRELGLGLDAIAEVLAGQRDELAALRSHQQRLLAERERLDRLADTVARTIAQLEGRSIMSAEALFEGFEEKQAQQEAALVDRYGDGVHEHFRTARERTAGWSLPDYRDAAADWDELDRKVLAVMRSGVRPDSPAALEVMAEHYASVARFWTPNRVSYTGLGQLYVEDPQFRARYDALAPGLAEFLRDAVAAYAEARLE